MIIRKYQPSDCKAFAELFYDTVHSVNIKDYTEEQVNAWAAGKADLSEWNDSFLAHYTVAAVEDGTIIGFGDIDENGYLDRLYVHKNYQRQGVGTAICNELEKAVSTKKITVHASITAKPFFESRGYKTVTEQQVFRNGAVLTNYIMAKEC